MYGAIFGDIIGSRFEFDRGGKTKDFELFTKECCWTDDTVMTISIMEALMNAGKEADADTIRKECIRSMKKWGRKYPNAGYGSSFFGWVLTQDPKPYGSFGNGSAMRVSAAGWIYDTVERTREAAKATAEVTHNHPEGIKGAECTAAVMFLARTGKTKEEIKEYVIREFGYDISKTVDELRPLHEHVEWCQDSLPKALASFFEGDSYEDVVRNAVSLGGDTDTLAAIAGAMGDAMYGVPLGIITKGYDYIEEDMKAVLNDFQTFLNGKPEDPYKDNRLIKMASEVFGNDRSRKNLFNLFNTILDRMFTEAEAPMAMVDVNGTMDYEKIMNLSKDDTFSFDKEMRLRIDTVGNGNGKEWIPLYTDEEEISKGQTANIHINMSITDIVKSAYYSDRAEGLIINPFGAALTMPKDILKLIVEKYDEIKGGDADE